MSIKYTRKPADKALDHREDPDLLKALDRLDQISARMAELNEFLRNGADPLVSGAEDALVRAETLTLAGREADVAGAQAEVLAAKVKRANAIVEREDLMAELADLKVKLPALRVAAKAKAVESLHATYRSVLARARKAFQAAAEAEVALSDVCRQAEVQFPEEYHDPESDGFRKAAGLPNLARVEYFPEGQYEANTQMAGRIAEMDRALESLERLNREDQDGGGSLARPKPRKHD